MSLGPGDPKNIWCQKNPVKITIYPSNLFVCLFVCLVDKTRAVKPLGRFHSRILSFTQDDPAFSTKTAQRALQVAKVGNLQVDELARLIIWCNFTGKLDKLGCLYAGDSNRFLIDPHEIL